MSNLLHERLRSLRTSKGLSQRQLAELLGLPRGTYTHYELGRRTPDLPTLMKIADLHHVSLDYLTGYTDRPPTRDEWAADHPDKDYPLAGRLGLAVADQET